MVFYLNCNFKLKKGAEKFYTTANNAVRSETPEQAVKLDNLVKGCWQGHQRHYLIENKTLNFTDKLEECKNLLENIIL